MKLREAKDAVDHLVLAADDLQRGIEWFEQKTGVRAVIGGRHPNRGTQNALLSLGNRQYLEILAPDPQQTGHPSHAELAKITTPRLVLWASATEEIDALAQKAKAARLSAMGPLDGARARPDGKLLKWRSLNIGREADKNRMYFNVLPFFIQWDKASLHPSQDSPTGCRLLLLEFAHPQADAILAAMKTLGLNAKIIKAASPTIKATLQTPKGKIELV
ncbi:MAG TPA: VOC family protein [Blastocatellia bacterium]|nr:VOC family protein [Blastocatellia bacterium]HMX26307.1 VOC family protein [Blastocatellia bacterium]HMY71159.1 VOC family protein [Blastocatellia bacterium]HMZ20815.1 VOC family protein [Blastocatellia bacterium]HNG31664.1 VOC family protein [Blastocatellia bacterium]